MTHQPSNLLKKAVNTWLGLWDDRRDLEWHVSNMWWRYFLFQASSYQFVNYDVVTRTASSVFWFVNIRHFKSQTCAWNVSGDLSVTPLLSRCWFPSRFDWSENCYDATNTASSAFWFRVGRHHFNSLISMIRDRAQRFKHWYPCHRRLQKYCVVEYTLLLIPLAVFKKGIDCYYKAYKASVTNNR